jgi:hypothetical protein
MLCTNSSEDLGSTAGLVDETRDRQRAKNKTDHSETDGSFLLLFFLSFLVYFFSRVSIDVTTTKHKSSNEQVKHSISFPLFKLRIDMESARQFVVYCRQFEPNVVVVDLVAKRQHKSIRHHNNRHDQSTYLSFNTGKWNGFACFFCCTFQFFV